MRRQFNLYLKIISFSIFLFFTLPFVLSQKIFALVGSCGCQPSEICQITCPSGQQVGICSWECASYGGGGGECTPSCGSSCGQGDGCGGTCPSDGIGAYQGWTPSSWCGVVTQSNSDLCGSVLYQTSTCTECGPHISAWSSCNANHKRTRTCTTDCNTTSLCADVAVEEDCQGSIRGTIFDATDVTSCPSFNPTTGYLVGVDTNLTANNRTFGMADQSNTSPHPWSIISASQTDSTGNYAVTVYAPATYTYDFSSLRDMYVVSEGPKLTCTSIAATVPGNNPSCGTQPCSLVNNMSFGFNRYWGGWWQAVGASVHAEDGLRSNIPTPLAAEQSLITEDTNGRSGVVSYGTILGNMLGVNLGAQMSAKLWEVQSNYESIIYDYGYFAQRAKRFTTTDWNGTSPIVYDDNGSGYQIFKVAGDVTNFNYNPTGTEKLIFLVNGNVTVTSNLLIPEGAFMAVIANGDLTFDTAVTRADGWFLAKNINVPCIDANSDLICDRTDTQFLGNGSFVAWRDINLRRDRDGAANITGPSSKFTYRTDLFTNAPDPLKNTTKFYKPFIP